MDKNEILTEIKIKYPNFDLFLEFSKDNIKKEELIFLLQSNANIEEKYINHFSILIFDDKVTYNFYIQDEISKSEFIQKYKSLYSGINVEKFKLQRNHSKLSIFENEKDKLESPIILKNEEYKQNENKYNKFLEESSLDEIQLIKDLEKKIYPIKKEKRIKRNNNKNKFNPINEYNSIVKPINNCTFSTIEPLLINISLKNNQKKSQSKKINNTLQNSKNNSIKNLRFKEKYENILSQIKPKHSFIKENNFDNVLLKNTKSESLMFINSTFKTRNFNYKNSFIKNSKMINKENNNKLKRELFKKYLNLNI